MPNRASSDPWLDVIATPIRGVAERVAGAVREADDRVSEAVNRRREAAEGLYASHGHRIPSPAVRVVNLMLPPRLSHSGWSPGAGEDLLVDTIAEPILGAVSQVREVARDADERVCEVVGRKRRIALELCGAQAERIPTPAMRVVNLVLPPRLSHPGWTPGTGDDLLVDLLTEPIMEAVSQVREVARDADDRVSEAVHRKRRRAIELYGAYSHHIPPTALRVVSLMLPPRLVDGGAPPVEGVGRAAWSTTALRGRPRRRPAPARFDELPPAARPRPDARSHAPRGAVRPHRPGSVTPHTLLLAAPRGFCAGVVRAVDALEMVVEREPPPIYAFHEIVHNRHIVESFEARGVVFIDDVAEAPDGARIVFSAHGVSPAVVEDARRRDMRIIDATCPLVTRVHLETKRAASQGYDVLLVGHRGHDEAVGTVGEAPEQTRIVEDPAEVAALGAIERPVFVVTQTTLSMDDTAGVIGEIRDRYPAAEIRNDICYATTNRQHAARAIAQQADLVLVVGSRNSSNSMRLREVAEDAGATAYLVDGIDDVDPAWYEGVEVVGLTSGASVPDALLDPIIEDLKARGVTKVEPVVLTEEDVEFRLPDELEA